MKIRNGFVSNSSSSSFVILKDNLYDSWDFSLEEHKHVLKAHQRAGLYPENHTLIYSEEVLNEKLDEVREHVDKVCEENFYMDSWEIVDYRGYILCHSMLDNFDLISYLREVFGVGKISIVLEISSHAGFKIYRTSKRPRKESEGIRNLKKIIKKTFYKGDNSFQRRLKLGEKL